MSDIKSRMHGGSEVLSGFVNIIPSAVATQALASAGAHWLMIDQEHGPIGPETLHSMIAATAGTNCSPWVRVARREDFLVKTALDAGAEGIVFPLVTSADDAARCVSFTRYPPKGVRGWGPFVAHSRWGTGLFDYGTQRGEKTVCVLLIETRSAIENIDQICQVEGIDCLLIAPFDLSTDLGVSGRLDAPELIQAVQEAERAILKANIPLGGAALTKEQTQAVVARGYRVLAHHFDVLVLKHFVREALSWVKQ
jgi:4-hydroxy-2-oxoheptanedioate aldolase